MLLGKSFHISGPQFLHLQIGTYSAYLTGLPRAYYTSYIPVLVIVPGPGERSVENSIYAFATLGYQPASETVVCSMGFEGRSVWALFHLRAV